MNREMKPISTALNETLMIICFSLSLRNGPLIILSTKEYRFIRHFLFSASEIVKRMAAAKRMYDAKRNKSDSYLKIKAKQTKMACKIYINITDSE
jgi:hypothetical protein